MKQLLIRLPFLYLADERIGRKKMTKNESQRLEEAHVTLAEVERMKTDSTLNIVLAMQDPNEDKFFVHYYRKDIETIPFWIRVAA